MLLRSLLIASSLILLAFICWAWPRPIPTPDAYIQSAPSPFTKIDMQGNVVPLWGGPWQCVYDSATGLLWEVKTDSESIHDAYWTYSWYSPKSAGVENSGDCYFEKDRCDTNDLIRKSNLEKTCGVANWRLPKVDELRSLISNTQKPGEPTIDKNFFPHTKRGDYWTSEHQQKLKGVYEYLGEGANAINFIEGQTVVLPYRNAAFVRLVSSDFELKDHKRFNTNVK